MPDLEVVWKYESGGLAVWEVEHLFGHELHFGSVRDGRLVPVRWITLHQPLDDIDKRFCRSAVHWWEIGDWSRMTSLLADLASGG